MQASANEEIRVANVALTSPDRVLFPDQGTTKRQLAQYYKTVAAHMLPFVAGRPLSLVRCPRGRDQHCFFQRHLDESAPGGIDSVRIDDGDGASDYVAVHDLSGLIGLVQLGVLEMHAWGARADDPDHADQLVFDLDPGLGATWPDVIHGARWLHGRLAELGLRSFVRTTGGKGLHVVAPLTPAVDWDIAKAFSKALAKELADDDPHRFIVEASKAKRAGKVFIDYLRNARGASSIANYSTRARPGAPVATPLVWTELAQLESPAHYTVENMPERIRSLLDDPWEGFSETRQTLDKTTLTKVRAYD
jgi:bifunctional non-homologous end joining protein LigD